jgi:hypothetical protein
MPKEVKVKLREHGSGETSQKGAYALYPGCARLASRVPEKAAKSA